MIRKACHYAVLAAILLGVPAICAHLSGNSEIWEGVKSFPPRTEDWGFHSEKLWSNRCPFSWPWFLGLALFTISTMRPFVVRWARAMARRRRERPKAAARRFPWWGWAGVAELAAAWVLAWGKFDCLSSIQPLISYMPLWIGYIVIVNALCVMRSGTSPLTRRPGAYLLTFPASALFWWFFEYLNRYVWNWYYLGVSHMSAAEYMFFATICFSSVLPAVSATAAFLHTFDSFADENYAGMAKLDVRGWRTTAFLFAVAATGLAGIAFAPQWTFPLLWLSPLAVFVLLQSLFREESAFDAFKAGNWSLAFRYSVAALVCGLAWETWNFYAAAKWVYSVPYVHAFQIWEMPLLGFAGYLPFGLECAAVTAWICPDLVEK